MSRFQNVQPPSSNRIDIVRERARKAVRALVASPLRLAGTTVGLLAIVVGVVLTLLAVSSTAGEVIIACGSVVDPAETAAATSCGERLSVQAVRGGTLAISGVLLAAMPFITPRAARLVIIIGTAAVVATFINLTEESGGVPDAVIGVVAIAVTAAVGSRGFGRTA